ncbi:hypothetical protein BJ165DRAFT_1515248 [Panaeolus papilionaceus]|nr:hypothetical protein BJ165DRAFT_1515248 [Panaeolus papilionaceus]
MQLFTIASFLTISSVFLTANAVVTELCTSLSLSGNNILRGSCRDGSGNIVNSALDLNACFASSGASLVCRANGNFAAFGCTGCTVGRITLTTSTIQCNCPSSRATGNIDQCVGLNNGLLVCNV